MKSLQRTSNWLLTALTLVAVFFIFFRIVLRLLGADPTSLFSGFVYLISDVFLLPYLGMMENIELVDGSVLDVVATVGLMGYVAGYLLLLALINILFRLIEIDFGKTRSTSQANT